MARRPHTPEGRPATGDGPLPPHRLARPVPLLLILFTLWALVALALWLMLADR